jgi:hypothetical protein
MAENRLQIDYLLPSIQYPFYRKIQEESIAEPDQFIIGSSRSVINELLAAKLLEIKNFPNQTGMSSEDYYNHLSDDSKNYFFSRPQAVLILNELRGIYHLSNPSIQRPSTPPPSIAEQSRSKIFATPPRRSRKTLKRKFRKNKQ